MYKKLSLPYSTMHELATHTHTHTYAHIIILLTCGCNFLEVRVSRAVHRARGGPIRPMLSYITCTARPTPSLTNRPQSEDVTPTAMICVPTDDSCHTKSPNKKPQIMPTVRLMER